MKVRVGVVGVTGYSGLELIRILLRHPAAQCVVAMASESTGKKALAEIHPQLRGLCELDCRPLNLEALSAEDVDTVFFCTPNEVSYELVSEVLSRGIRVIDLSGSFRLKNPADYVEWYGFKHEKSVLLETAAYGLPEWNAASIRDARLVANPGCYPTSVLLALLPLARAGMIDLESGIFCDSKSGVTGAGRSARLEMLFGEVSGNFRPYSPITHRHAPEICQELPCRNSEFTFVPHLLPVKRGILSTIYVSLKERSSPARFRKEFENRYGGHRFIRILGDTQLPELRAVNHTNFCDVGWRLTDGGRRAVIFSAIDNLIKGAAGQAVQNFNLMHAFEEHLGLLEGGEHCA